MKKNVNQLYPLRVWLTTTLSFPSLFVLYRLLDWEKEQFSVLGVSALFSVAVIIGSVLSLPSFLLSGFVGRQLSRRSITARSVQVLTALSSVAMMFVTLAIVDNLFYPLYKNVWLLGTAYTVCVAIASLAFEPVAIKRTQAFGQNGHRNVFWRIVLPNAFSATKQS